METTASIIAVAQLCEKVVKYIVAVSGAKHEKYRLRSQVRSCHHLLLQLQDEAEDSEEAEEWSKTLKLLSTPLARLHEALSLAAAALSARDSIAEKLGWPFKEKDVEKLIEAIKCEMDMVTFALHNNATSLLIAINAGSKRNEQHLIEVKAALEIRNENTNLTLRNINGELESIQTTQIEVRHTVEELHGRQAAEGAMRKRQRILDWLTPIDHASEQRDAISRRQKGTGEWLLRSQDYQDWISTDSRTLFCPGIPGAGKTVFASIINADLWERYHHDPTIGLAHLFCNYRRHNEQTLEALLSGLLKQLVQHQVPLPECVTSLYDTQQRGASDRIEATTEALRSVMATYSRVFIVLDALDECSTSQGCRTRLLSSIQNLQRHGHINILATSRFIPEITEKFRTACQLEIQADSNDVRRYLSDNISRLPGFVQDNIGLREEIVSKIVEAVRGMFLLAKLHLDSLIGKRSAKKVKLALNELATGSDAYDSAYDSAMKRINGQVSDQAELAKQALAFLTCARRPLSTEELREALAVEIGEPDMDQENYPDIEDVLASCLGLVTVDDESEIIRLVHYTTQEYLQRTLDRWFPDAHAMIASTCISYLSLDRYADPDSLDPSGDCKWYTYSARHWVDHARLAPSSLTQVIGFLNRQTNVIRCTFYDLEDIDLPIEGYRFLDEIDNPFTTGLHVAVKFDLVDATMALIVQGFDLKSRDRHGRTPLIVAAQMGYRTIAEMLVEHHSPVNARVEWRGRWSGCTALHLAAVHDHVGIVKLLIDGGAAIDAKDNTDRTALRLAVTRNNPEVVKQLIDAKADLMSPIWPGSSTDNTYRSENMRTLLSLAALQDYSSVNLIQLLLAAGVDVNERQDRTHETALYYAISHGKTEEARILLGAGADPNTNTYFGTFPLMIACMRRDEDKIIALAKILLDAGAHIDSQDVYGRTTYQWTRAYEKGRTGKYLLERGADPELGSQRRPDSAVASGD